MLAWYTSHDILPGSTVVGASGLWCGQARSRVVLNVSIPRIENLAHEVLGLPGHH
jgi:hypothetical protein